MNIIQSPSHSASFNLAAEEYLFSQRTDDIIFLYVNDPCVVLGRNQDVLEEVDLDFCSLNHIPIFKRISGGGTVYHDSGNLNYCFISNRLQGELPLNADFLQPIVTVLNDFEIEVVIGKRNDLWLPGGNKVSGTASHIGKIRELHHGTLLYDVELDKLEKSLSPKKVDTKSRAIKSVHSPVINIRTFLNDKNSFAPDSSVFFELFIQKLLEVYGLDTVSFFRKGELTMIQPILSITYQKDIHLFH